MKRLGVVFAVLVWAGQARADWQPWLAASAGFFVWGHQYAVSAANADREAERLQYATDIHTMGEYWTTVRDMRELHKKADLRRDTRDIMYAAGAVCGVVAALEWNRLRVRPEPSGASMAYEVKF